MTTTQLRPTARSSRPLAFGRTFLTELRKLVDTRAGLAVVIGAAAGVGVFAGGRAFFPNADTELGQLATMALWPGGIGVMVLAVLLVGGEFSTGSAAVTFTLEPRRGRVLAAKTAVVGALVAAVGVLAVLAGALMVVIAPALTGQPLGWGFDAARFAAAVGSTLVLGLAALAWALLTRSTPAPIVLLLVWPTLAMLVGSISPAAATVLDYLSLDPTYALVEGDPAGLVKLATSVLVWIVVPGLLGVRRLLRGDLS